MSIPVGFRLERPLNADAPVAFLYYLRCPDSDAVRYVGSAVDPVTRHRQHITESIMMIERQQLWAASKKQRWICDLVSESKFPVLEVVACVPRQFVMIAESQLYDSCIQHGFELLNGCRPGDKKPTSYKTPLQKLLTGAAS